MLAHTNPSALIADFVADMQQRAESDNTRKAAIPAVQQLFDMLRTDLNIHNNSYLRMIMVHTSTRTKSIPRYSVIWPLEQVLHYITEVQGDPAKLPWTWLMATTAIIFMIFVPCRPIALIRLDPTKAKQDPYSDALLVPTKEKTDRGRDSSILCIRSLPQKLLSPRFYYDICLQRSTKLGCPDALLCSNSGRPYTRTDNVCKAGKACLGRSNIPAGYGLHSVRHALIQWLYSHGYDEKEVNAYTGHSNNYHTTLKFYYHLDKAWIGKKISEAGTPKLQPVAESTQRTMLHEALASNEEETEIEAVLPTPSEQDASELQEEEEELRRTTPVHLGKAVEGIG
jgi:hypothetical protein